MLEGVMEPAMPFRGDTRCFDGARIDHPATLAIFGLIIAISEIVFADRRPGPSVRDERSDCRAMSPSEKLTDPRHHGTPNLRVDYRSANTAATMLMNRDGVEFLANPACLTIFRSGVLRVMTAAERSPARKFLGHPCTEASTEYQQQGLRV